MSDTSRIPPVEHVQLPPDETLPFATMSTLFRTMAHRPELMRQSMQLLETAMRGGTVDARLKELGRVLDPGERARLLREIGDHKSTEFAEMPLFWLFAEVAVNPRVIAEYVFPGSIPGFYTHLEYIKLAP